MKRKEILITAITGLAAFTAGLLIGMTAFSKNNSADVYDNASSAGLDEATVSGLDGSGSLSPSGLDEANSAGPDDSGSPTIRINDGCIEWYNKSHWEFVASVEELQNADPFNIAEAARREFEEAFELEKLEAAKENSFNLGRDDNRPDIQTVEQPTTPSTQAPSQTASSQQPASSASSKPAAGETASEAATSPAEQATQAPTQTETQPTQTPSQTETQPTEAPSQTETQPTETPSQTETQPTETPSDSMSGDAEDMEWSDDYL